MSRSDSMENRADRSRGSSPGEPVEGAAGLLRTIALLHLMLIFAAAGPLYGSAFKGKVINGSGGPLEGPVPISITSQEGGEWSTADGREDFRLDNLPGDPATWHSYQALYCGITYEGEFQIPTGADTTIEIVVYDTTSDMTGIYLEEGEIIFISSEGGMTVDQVFRIRNGSNPPRTIAGRGEGNMVIPLPITLSDPGRITLAVSSGSFPVEYDPIFTGEPKSVALDYPLRPGVTAVAISYEISYPGQFVYSSVFPWDAPKVSIITEPGVTITSEQLFPFAESALGKEGMRWPMMEIARDEELMFIVAGRPEVGETSAPQEGQVILEEAIPAGEAWVIIGAMAAILFGALVVTAGRRSTGGGR